MNKQKILNELEQLKQEQENITAKINELETKYNALPDEPHSSSELKIHETFYYIKFDGTIAGDTWHDTKTDRNLLAIGNVFRTKEEAEFEVERLKVIAELKEYAKEFEHDKHNYYIYFSFLLNKIKIYSSQYSTDFDIYFSSKEIAEQAIKAVGEERIKKYYLGVE